MQSEPAVASGSRVVEADLPVDLCRIVIPLGCVAFSCSQLLLACCKCQINARHMRILFDSNLLHDQLLKSQLIFYYLSSSNSSSFLLSSIKLADSKANPVMKCHADGTPIPSKAW